MVVFAAGGLALTDAARDQSTSQAKKTTPAKPAPKPVERLTPAEAEAELARLAEEIAAADRLYYQDDAPKLTDAEYDALRQRNLAIEARFPGLKRADSPTERVGAAPVAKFATVRHAVPMLSLENAFSEADVSDFLGVGGTSELDDSKQEMSPA